MENITWMSLGQDIYILSQERMLKEGPCSLLPGRILEHEALLPSDDLYVPALAWDPTQHFF